MLWNLDILSYGVSGPPIGNLKAYMPTLIFGLLCTNEK
jgi:hypothetical protein